MQAIEAQDILQDALQQIADTWQGYSPADVPFAIYDDETVLYINHPSPPNERPSNLYAATAIKIGGVMTATIPAQYANEASELVPLAYHEGFHVYQAHKFADNPSYDFFNALAHYPEFDASYRAAASLQATILNHPSMPVDERLRQLVPIHDQLQLSLANSDIQNYERAMERQEGTASYVEAKARLALYGISPNPVPDNYGWGRFYDTGAALCRLLDKVSDNWQAVVENGSSLSEVIYQLCDTPAFGINGWETVLKRQERYILREKMPLQEQVETLMADSIRLIYPKFIPIYRSFNPRAMHSWDGALLHTQSMHITFEGHGEVAADGAFAIDDITNGHVILPKSDITIAKDTLTISSDTVQAEITSVEQVDDDTYRIIE